MDRSHVKVIDKVFSEKSFLFDFFLPIINRAYPWLNSAVSSFIRNRFICWQRDIKKFKLIISLKLTLLLCIDPQLALFFKGRWFETPGLTFSTSRYGKSNYCFGETECFCEIPNVNMRKNFLSHFNFILSFLFSEVVF